jgi:hypothetical protein
VRPGTEPDGRSDRDAEVTFAGRRSQETLLAIHDHLRDELAKLQDLVDQLRIGTLSPAAARSHVATMTMRQNYWTLGAFCAAYCRLLTLHHTIEDERLFTDLRNEDPDLGPVLDRLSAEHEVIAGILDAVDHALVAMIGADGDRQPELAGVEKAVERLENALLEHLDGEESALLGAIGRLSVAI